MKNIKILGNHSSIRLDLTNDYSGQLTVLVSSNPDNFSNAEKKQVHFENGISEEMEQPLQRTFYQLEFDGDTYVGAQRRVPINGLYNCRDLGGYFTTDGRMTKWGKIYRSDAPDHLAESDSEYLRKMSFFSIIDFRSPTEIAVNPDIEIGEQTHYNFDPHARIARKASETPTKKSTKDQEKVERLVELSKSKTGQEELVRMQKQMVVQMRELILSLEAQQAYRDFLTVLLREEVPNLFHCQGGKDRTGWAAAIILSLLGVDKRTIYEDYLLTEIYNQPRNDSRMAIYQQFTDNSFVLEYLSSLQKTKKEYLDSAFHTMEEKYGTMENYAVKALSISEENIHQLKEIYLYPEKN